MNRDTARGATRTKRMSKGEEGLSKKGTKGMMCVVASPIARQSGRGRWETGHA